MMDFKRLHKEFLKYEEKNFIKDSVKWLGNNARTSIETRKKFYKNYYRTSFFGFLRQVKSIIHSPSPFNLIVKGRSDDWNLLQYLTFLKESGVIKVQRNGKVIGHKDLKDLIPAPYSEEEITKRIEKKLKVKIDPDASVLDFVGQFTDFNPKGNWDQMPVSQGSAIFTIKKILDHLPLYDKFLFIGDDDFMSFFLGIVEPKVGSLVIDADSDLLSSINDLSSRFKLGIETRNIDLRKKPSLKGRFTGFLCNPPYTEEGATGFLGYGVDQLGLDGGVVFLTVGNANIRNRNLFMQKFFTQRNLVIREMITEKITYPFLKLHSEDETCFNEMKELFDEKVITGNSKLGADLWIFDYLPFKVERLKKSESLYRYL